MSFMEIFAIVLILFIICLIFYLYFKKDKVIEQVENSEVNIEGIEVGAGNVIVENNEYPATYKEQALDKNSLSEDDLYSQRDNSINWAGLEEWYFKAAKNHKKQLRSCINSINFTIVFQVVLIFGIGIMIQASGNAGSGEIGILILGLIPISAMAYYYLSNTYKSVQGIFLENNYVNLRTEQFPHLWGICTELRKKMALENYGLNIFYLKSNTLEAHVTVEKNEIFLILSRGLISYSHNNLKETESIIAHEFGHVAQGDNKIGLIAKKTIQIPAIIGTVSFVIMALFMVVTLFEGGNFTTSGGSAIVIVSNYWMLVRSRKSSEFLADMASYIFVQHSKIENLIADFMPEKGSFTYPSRNERLKSIETIKKFYAKKE